MDVFLSKQQSRRSSIDVAMQMMLEMQFRKKINGYAWHTCNHVLACSLTHVQCSTLDQN